MDPRPVIRPAHSFRTGLSHDEGDDQRDNNRQQNSSHTCDRRHRAHPPLSYFTQAVGQHDGRIQMSKKTDLFAATAAALILACGHSACSVNWLTHPAAWIASVWG